MSTLISRTVIITIVVCLLTSCSSATDKVQLEAVVGPNVQAISDNPLDYQPVQWAMIPGGDEESLTFGPSYHILITSPSSIPPDASLSAVLVAGDAALFMTAVHQDPTKSDNRFYLETSSWTEYLKIHSATDLPWNIYFSLSESNKRFHAELPTLQELKLGSTTLQLTEVPQRALDGYKPTGRELFIPGKIPAIARIQGNEKMIYIFVKKE